jgi:hypothetical protein
MMAKHKKSKKLLDKVEEEIEQLTDAMEESDVEGFDIGDEDYGFILSNDGTIKALILPREYCITPESVLKICKVLGIKGLDELQPQYMH